MVFCKTKMPYHSMEKRACINIDNFSFSYGTSKILDNIDMEVLNGETTSILGMSGSGKSTLLKSICGLNLGSANHSGSITIDGCDNSTFLQSNKGKLSFMFQTLSLMPNLTVEKNIKFPSKARSPKCPHFGVSFNP